MKHDRTKRTELRWATVELADRKWLLLATELGVCRIIFPHEGLADFQAWIKRFMPEANPVEDVERLAQTGIVAWLQAYFAGERSPISTVQIDLLGTPFQKQVWAALANVPYGEIRTYSEIAATIGKPDAVRAVGAANGANPLPILLPCHRIIGTNRKLTGFRGGLAMKRELLRLEGIEGVEDGGHARFLF